MSDSIVLVCAVLACLASGVLLAYGACVAFFQLFFKMRAAHISATPAPVATPAPPVLQG